MIELFNLPPIIGMLPLLVFIIMAFTVKSQILSLIVATVLCIILSGTSMIEYSLLFSDSLKSDLALIGLIILMSSGLGKVLETTKVSHTIVYSIVNRIGVNTENKAIMTTYICSLVICGLLGTLSGGNSIIAPIIIPVVAAAGLSRSTVGAIFQCAGEVGLIWGPLSPAVAALLMLTGQSYGRMMLTSAIPFGIVWLIGSYIAVRRIQRTTKDTDQYDLDSFDEAFVPTREHKRLTIIFIVSFLVLIVYGLINREALGYLPFVMLLLVLILAAFSKQKIDDSFNSMIKGMSSALPLFLLFLLFNPLFEMMTEMGAFDALADIFARLATSGGTGVTAKALVVILGSLVGGFGVEGTAVVQMQITHGLFEPIINMVGLSIDMWAIALIAASRITSSVYPTANMLGQMGIARSNNVKAMLTAGWAAAGASLIFIVFYAFIGAALF